MEALRRHSRAPLEQLCDSLLDEVDVRLDDDVALLAVRIPAT
jgi:hypothetical protein